MCVRVSRRLNTRREQKCWAEAEEIQKSINVKDDKSDDLVSCWLDLAQKVARKRVRPKEMRVGE